jgi:pilus assembly protein TadC
MMELIMELTEFIASLIWSLINFLFWAGLFFGLTIGVVALIVAFPLPCIAFILLWIALKN